VINCHAPFLRREPGHYDRCDRTTGQMPEESWFDSWQGQISPERQYQPPIEWVPGPFPGR